MRWLGAAPVLCALACTAGGQPSDPPGHPFHQDSLERIGAYLDGEVATGAFPGVVLAIGTSRGLAMVSTHGVLGVDDPTPVNDSTIYDLASLTKVVGLTTAVMFLVDSGRLDLDMPVANIVPEFTGDERATVRIRHLLTHTSGLPAWAPLYAETADADAALAWIYHAPLESSPGETYVYSDLGAILLTQAVQRVAGSTLDDFLSQRLFGPIGMADTGFRPDAALVPRIAPTEYDPWRGRMVRGEVHDENAYHLGGVSGHAGLFSTALDLARFAAWLLDNYHNRASESGPRLSAGLVRDFTTRQSGPEGSTRALGWDTPTAGGRSSAGSLMSPAAFGHTGFTGTSIWIDPTLDLYVILLTNRVHPTRVNNRHIPVRSTVADMTVRALR